MRIQLSNQTGKRSTKKKKKASATLIKVFKIKRYTIYVDR